ncbi:hypothetical protein [Caulobacter soli]|uniref:hypothetical protein n=1 Tax=Caulobacter soli TaxID=2708539 RepID=UPI0013EB6CAA|nr:hypothetical protein [Caulobacter soli]
MTHVFRLCAFCLAALGLGLILDGYGAFAVAHPRTLATAVVAGIPARLKSGLRVEVVDSLVPVPPLDGALPLQAALEPCLPTPRLDLALLRPSLVRG